MRVLQILAQMSLEFRLTSPVSFLASIVLFVASRKKLVILLSNNSSPNHLKTRASDGIITASEAMEKSTKVCSCKHFHWSKSSSWPISHFPFKFPMVQDLVLNEVLFFLQASQTQGFIADRSAAFFASLMKLLSLFCCELSWSPNAVLAITSIVKQPAYLKTTTTMTWCGHALV